MDTVHSANLALRFLLELGALAALAWWGFHVGDSTASELILGLGLPLLAAIVWGLFIAPRARFPVPLKVRAPVEMGIFVAAVLALWGVGQEGLAVAFAVLAAVSELLLYGLGEPLAGQRRV
ncbi:MAG TPA: YrdB family protein [Gaiellaceae bacterium]|nr:YrdB family protein [Gaiellaceae bacterium]